MTITPDPGPGKSVATSALEAVTVRSASRRVRLSITSEGQEIYSGVLYTYAGAVTLDDFSSIIEEYFRASGLSLHDVTFSASDPDGREPEAALTLSVIYCEYSLPAGIDPGAGFWSLLQSQRVHPSSRISIPGAFHAGEELAVLMSGSDASGRTTHQTARIRVTRENLFDISIPALLEYFPDVARPSMAVIRWAEGYKALFFDRTPGFFTLRFRNMFNAREYVDIWGVTFTKTEAERSVATVGQRSVPYDTRTTRTYETTTGPLTRPEALALSQLAHSREVEFIDSAGAWPVIVTDSTCEVSDDDGESNKVKISWRFACVRPRLHGTSLSGLALDTGGIFTHEFTPQFS